tara:strand:+ start:350 stop:466 length:117 start_codon:yes stop_codon:yes gene_type:complete
MKKTQTVVLNLSTFHILSNVIKFIGKNLNNENFKILEE